MKLHMLEPALSEEWQAQPGCCADGWSHRQWSHSSRKPANKVCHESEAPKWKTAHISTTLKHNRLQLQSLIYPGYRYTERPMTVSNESVQQCIPEKKHQRALTR